MHYSLVDSAWPNLRGEDSMIAEHIMMTEIANEYDIEKEMLDLHPYIDREPCLVLAGSSIRAAHKMIRSGQETVYVCEKVDVVGTVKRRDILPGMLEIALHEKDEQLAKGIKKRKIHRHRPKTASGADNTSVTGERISTGDRNDEGSITSLSFLNVDPDADSHHEIVMFEPRFYQLLYDFIFRRSKHKLLEVERKEAYGGRTQLGRMSFRYESDASSKSDRASRRLGSDGYRRATMSERSHRVKSDGRESRGSLLSRIPFFRTNSYTNTSNKEHSERNDNSYDIEPSGL